MTQSSDLLVTSLIDLLTNGRTSPVLVKSDYKGQIEQLKKYLKNDRTGLINTVLEFMVHSSSVNYTFETKNDRINEVLETWSRNVNQGISIDIPKGLRAFSSQYFRERWTSSFIGIKARWEEVDGFILPTKLWIVDGSNINVEGKDGSLGTYDYTLGKDKIPFRNTQNESVFIRKPFEMWYEKFPTPYLVKKGALHNALLKSELLKKQADLMESILPYLLAVKAGTDTLAKLDSLPTEGDVNKVVDQIKEIKEDYNKRIRSKGMVGGFSYDVNIEHLIPDLTKFINESIVKPIDKNILSSLGLIELEGFSSSRQEAIFNPKVLVEEIKDGVTDLALLYEDLMNQIAERNKEAFPRLFNNKIRVIPGLVKAFITDNMRILARSAYDRGLIDKKSFDENYMDLDFETVVTRRDMEARRNLIRRLYPYVIMNQEKDPADLSPENPEQTKEETPEKQKTEQDVEASFDCPNASCNFILEMANDLPEDQVIQCPECLDKFFFSDVKARKHIKKERKKKKQDKMKSDQDYIQAPFETIDELPDNVKSVLPVGAQMIWLRVFNSVEEETGNEERAIRSAWSQVGKKYKKVPGKKKWVKR